MLLLVTVTIRIMSWLICPLSPYLLPAALDAKHVGWRKVSADPAVTHFMLLDDRSQSPL